MDIHLFDKLLEKVKPHLTKKDTRLRDSILAHIKLCVTLCFLASGQSYMQLRYAFQISTSAISEFVPQVCKALYSVLKEDYMCLSASQAWWLQLAKEFEAKGQFPHAVGTIDANAQFIAYDLGSAASQSSDGGIFKKSRLETMCISNFPSLSNVGQSALPPIPYFLLDAHCTAIGDKNVFNYRHSRARRIVGNAYILCARFRVLLRTLELDVENSLQAVRACLALHNSLLMKKAGAYNTPGFLDIENEHDNVRPGSWRNLLGDSSVRSNSTLSANIRSSTVQAKEI